MVAERSQMMSNSGGIAPRTNGPSLNRALDPAGVEDLDQALRRNARLQEDKFVEAVTELIRPRLAGGDPFLERRDFEVTGVLGREDDAEGALVACPPAGADLGDEMGNDRVWPVTGFRGDLLDALPHFGTNARVIAEGERDRGGRNAGDLGQSADGRHISHAEEYGDIRRRGSTVNQDKAPRFPRKRKGRTEIPCGLPKRDPEDR